MTQEDKNLLLKDLCARLPYGVKVKFGNDVIPSPLTPHLLDNYWYTVDIYLKPYLRPMSTMTEEEKSIYSNYRRVVRGLGLMFEYNMDFTIEWLLQHHFDYRGLIEKGLALEAPKDMYKK